MSDLDDAIARARREIARAETPVRRRLWRAYRDALTALDADLESVTAMIAEAKRAGVPVSPDWLRRQARYQMLIADAEREFRRFTDTGLRIVADGQAAAVSGGAHSALEMANAAGITTGFGAHVNVPAVERLVSVLQPGSPVRAVLDGYGSMAARIIDDELVAGIIEGKSPREVQRSIRRRIAGGANQARLETLVRTESMRAFRGSLFDQYGAMGVERWRWTAAHGSRTCMACLSLSGRTFPMTEPFMAAHPNCFVAGTVVNGPEVQASTKRWYAGEVVDIRFASGDFLTVTPNHPVLTPQGWVAAGAIVEGGDVLRYDRPEREAAAINPDYDDRPAFIEDVAETFGGAVPMGAVTVPTSAIDFHGDGAGSEVSVIRTDRLLGHALQSRVAEPSLQDQFGRAGVGLSSFTSLGAGALGFERVHTSTGGLVGSSDEPLAFSGAGLRHTCVHGLGPSTDGDASLFQMPPDDEPLGAITLSQRFFGFAVEVPGGDLRDRQLYLDRLANQDAGILQDFADTSGPASVAAGERLDGLAGAVSTDHVISVNRRTFSGHVYNLQTSEGWYIANNIITHNCRCIPSPVSPYVTVESGPDWFARQPASTQRAMMPSQDAYDAWQRGDVTLNDFRGVRRSRVWGSSYVQRSGAGALTRAKGRAA